MTLVSASNPVWAAGVALFNEGEYWECHEVLEPLWLAASGPTHEFLSGVILLAAALHKAQAMNNPRGGRRNYAKALRHLAGIPDLFWHTEVRVLERRVLLALQEELHQPSFPLVL